MLKCPDKLRPYIFLALSTSVTWAQCGEGWLVILTHGRKRHLTEMVFSVEYSRFERKDLFYQLFFHGGEQTDPPSPLSCACSEGMKTNTHHDDGGSADKSVEWRRKELLCVSLDVCSHPSYWVETRACVTQSEVLKMSGGFIPCLSTLACWMWELAQGRGYRLSKDWYMTGLSLSIQHKP